MSDAGETKRIAMWSGPRNLSTAMMRSWENRSDTEVIDEPLYPYHLALTGMAHPMSDKVMAEGPTDLDEAIDRCLAPAASGESILYQKHMSAHLTPEIDRGWLKSLTHGLLLRHPHRVIRSYTRKWDVMPLSETGLPQQVELIDDAAVIIDSDDFLTDPAAYQEAICDRLGVAFDPAMLVWPTGRRVSDGVWGQVWYAAVEKSTRFGPVLGSVPTIDELPEPVRATAEAALPLYERLAERRMLL